MENTNFTLINSSFILIIDECDKDYLDSIKYELVNSNITLVTIDYDSYDNLDKKLSYIRNELFFNTDNSSILKRLRNNLNLTGELKI